MNIDPATLIPDRLEEILGIMRRNGVAAFEIGTLKVSFEPQPLGMPPLPQPPQVSSAERMARDLGFELTDVEEL